MRSSRPHLTLFALLWAIASLFHVWVNDRATGIWGNATPEAIAQAVSAAAALLVLSFPRRPSGLLCLATFGVALAWFEAPYLGNHTLVAALVGLGLLTAAAAAVLEDGRLDRGRFAELALPVARWVLLAFYSFAAFSKLNYGFLDPRVSCATQFFAEVVTLFGIQLPRAVNSSIWARLIPIATIVIELCVPLLLIVQRTRHLGVLLGLSFHGLIALDPVHPFQDFSAILVALFVLFLPDGFATWMAQRARQWPLPALVLRMSAVLGALGLTLFMLSPADSVGQQFLVTLRARGWIALQIALAGALLWYLASERPPPLPTRQALGLRRRFLVAVPLLAVLNGFTPYLEIKTSYGWNMYANLLTVNGRSNHLLVRRTLPLTDFQSDLVRLISSNDSRLQAYVVRGYDLPFLQLRAYLSHHPDVSLRYERGGTVYEVARARDDPALVEPVAGWKTRLFAFRAVDQQDPPRCQHDWLAAR